MRALAPTLIYAIVVAIHLIQIAVGDPQRTLGKALLMPVLIGAVLFIALGRHREAFADRRRRSGLVLLVAALGLSWAGDVLLDFVFLPGLVAFALAHLVYIGLFAGPARTRRPAWWSAAYVVWGAILVPVLWPHLGALAVPVAVYAAVLAGTAVTATGVSGMTAVGGTLFLASDSLLAFQMFWPHFDRLFPDPWRGITVMALYGAGQGLIAMGAARRLADRRRATPHGQVPALAGRG